jgi:hypothetical protein
MIGTGPVAVVSAIVMSAAPLLVLARQRSQAASDLRAAGVRVRAALDGRDGFALIACAGYALFAVFLLAAWSQTLLQTPAGILTRSYANRNDLALHLGIITRLASGDIFPPQHPEFAGAPLTYPFLADLGAALLVDAGATLHEAVVVQNTVSLLGLIALIYYWTRELTGSRLAALFSPPIVLFGSGLGWVVMLRDFRTAGVGPIEFLMHLPHSYTVRCSNLQWGNLATILLLPQRSLLMGCRSR